MATLKEIVEDNQTKGGRIFDIVVQILIVISIISFSLETMPDNSVQTKNWLYRIELVIVIFFSLEYVLRIIVADKPFKFIFSFFGLIDLAAILPFYLTVGLDLRSVRVFRLLRLFRAFKVLRYTKAIERFQKAFEMVKEEIFLFSIILLILLFLSSVGIYYFENAAQPDKFSSIINSMWFSVATITTVGYGDVYPVTPAGKIFSFAVLLIGLVLVAVPTGLIASAFQQVRKNEEMEEGNLN